MIDFNKCGVLKDYAELELPEPGHLAVDKAQCFRSARRFGAVGSSPDFSRVFSRHLASRHLNLSRYSSHDARLSLMNRAWRC